MLFAVTAADAHLSITAGPAIFLIPDRLDYDGSYSTMYRLVVVEDTGAQRHIGTVKIGQFGMREDQRRPEIPSTFDDLGPRFFSLGQDASYYENLNGLGSKLRERILEGLHDLAADQDLFEEALREKVTKESLLKSVPPGAVRGQFHRMAQGAARLTRYRFSFVAPQASVGASAPEFRFVVQPDSKPPTNIHVLIGRNGVGKTRLLESMVRTLSGHARPSPENGRFELVDADASDEFFANVVSVSFSAFDIFGPLVSREYEDGGVRYTYIGLKQVPRTRSSTPTPKGLTALRDEFVQALRNCAEAGRLIRWRRALATLAADPLFRDADLWSIAPEPSPRAHWERDAGEAFLSLSSGHKIVLLTMTSLVANVEERTLVLVDEPEAHLHPPLLSAFVRALSDVVIHQNGVAIIATHSPVVLQEVPRSCVWKLRRSGVESFAERPDVQTFGENVGVLTREVFGLEVTQSGFHRMLQDAVDEGGSFEAIVHQFQGQLGDEARAILRVLIAIRYTEVVDK